MNEAHYIVVDVETGGRDCKKNPITSIALMVLDRYSLKELDRYETFVKPYNNLKVEQEALDYTFVKIADINKGMDFKKLVDILIAFFDKYATSKGKYRDAGLPVIVGQNIPFDVDFIAELFRLAGKDLFYYVQRHVIDTWADSKRAFGNKQSVKHKLSISAERLGIKLNDAHGAMNDVIATAEIFRHFTFVLRMVNEEVLEEAGIEKKVKVNRKRDTFEF